jgi:hypothetical protein
MIAGKGGNTDYPQRYAIGGGGDRGGLLFGKGGLTRK